MIVSEMKVINKNGRTVLISEGDCLTCLEEPFDGIEAVISKIATGNDKESDNEGVELHCDFNWGFSQLDKTDYFIYNDAFIEEFGKGIDEFGADFIIMGLDAFGYTECKEGENSVATQ